MFQTILCFYVYVLESRVTSKLYIGRTDNLKRRVKEYNRGLNLSTKLNKPGRLFTMKLVGIFTMQNAERCTIKRVKEGDC